MNYIGNSLIAELYGVEAILLLDAEYLMIKLEQALKKNGFNILHKQSHKFTTRGAGVTGVFMLTESHAAFHTYPEWNCMTLDIVSCGQADSSLVLSALSNQLQPKQIWRINIPRLRLKDNTNDINLDGRIFTGENNYEKGDLNKETKFQYFQEGSTIWATYQGGGVVYGTIIGTKRSSGKLDLMWQHVTIQGELHSGTCVSIPEKMEDGRIRLIEQWHYTVGRSGGGVSSVVEQPMTATF